MRSDHEKRHTRRRWLQGVLALGAMGRARRGQGDEPIDVTRSQSNALRRAREVGLADLRATRSEHYAAAGDAPERFQTEALRLCEKLATSFLAHLGGKGIELKLPETPMTVVTLAGPDSYRAFKEGPVAETEGGYYDLDEDRLVIFDFQDAPGSRSRDLIRRVNTLTLVHESIHQLTFSGGLLRRFGDVPVALSEGLATYGELWQNARPFLGQINRPRLAVLADPRGGDWIPIERLLTSDDLFRGVETEQMAYAEAWLLTYQLLKTKEYAARFRAYLDRVRTRESGVHRADDAAETLGDLGTLDRALKRTANLLLRR